MKRPRLPGDLPAFTADPAAVAQLRAQRVATVPPARLSRPAGQVSAGVTLEYGSERWRVATLHALKVIAPHLTAMQRRGDEHNMAARFMQHSLNTLLEGTTMLGGTETEARVVEMVEFRVGEMSERLYTWNRACLDEQAALLRAEAPAPAADPDELAALREQLAAAQAENANLTATLDELTRPGTPGLVTLPTTALGRASLFVFARASGLALRTQDDLHTLGSLPIWNWQQQHPDPAAQLTHLRAWASAQGLTRRNP